jgi:hypothetical protein
MLIVVFALDGSGGPTRERDRRIDGKAIEDLRILNVSLTGTAAGASRGRAIR